MIPNPKADPRDQLMPRNKDELLGAITALMCEYMYASDAAEAIIMIEVLCRHHYVDGYNSATKQFGIEREFFKEELK